jgi:hypothetical protein
MPFTNSDEMVSRHQMAPLSRSNAALHRDAALARIGRARRWLIAGAAGLTGGLAAFVSATAHGHTLHRSTVVPAPTRATGNASSTAHMPPLASASSLGLQGPVANPQPPSSGGGQQQSNSSPSQPQATPAPAPAPSPAPSGGAVVSGGS